MRARRRQPRIPAELLWRLLAVAVALCQVAVAAPETVAAERHYLVLEGDPAGFAEPLATTPARVRLIERDWILIDLPASATPGFVERFPAARRVAGPLGEHRLYGLHEGFASEDQIERAGAVTVVHTADVWLVAVPAGVDVANLFASAERAGTESAASLAETVDRAVHHGCADAHPMPWVYDLRALKPRTPEELDHVYRRNRLRDDATRARLRGLAGQVNVATIEAIVREFAETAPGVPRSRFAGHPAFDGVVDLARSRLQSVFDGPGDTVVNHDFQLDYEGSLRTFTNLIARRPGRIPGSGRYVLGAHYDAIGSNTPDWQELTEAAPGADDNASGVACLLEAVRVLLQEEYDFDIELVLFSAEEAFGGDTELTGLVGSARLIDDLDYGPENVLGMVSVDMVGYNPRGVDSLTVVTNGRSEWLADLFDGAEDVVGAADRLDGVEKAVRPTFNRSDHGAFWAVGADAVLLVEVPEVEINNPNYHRTSDTVETLVAVDGFERIRRVAELIVTTIGQFANPTGGSLRFTSNELTLRDSNGENLFIARTGELVDVRARIFNDGPALSNVQVTGTRTIEPSRVASGAIGRQTTSIAAIDTSYATWGSGSWREIVSAWTPTEDLGGGQDIRLDLTIAADDFGPVQLSTISPIDVLGSSLRVRDAYVRPNPVRGDLDGAALAFQVSERAFVGVTVYDALGQLVAETSDDLFFDVGRAEIPLRDILGDADVPSGIYLVRLAVDSRAFDTGDDVIEVTMAVAR